MAWARPAARLKPRDVDAWFRPGILCPVPGHQSEVIEVYEKLKTLDPKLADKFFREEALPWLMATYGQIQDYVKDKYGFTAKTCWIAHHKAGSHALRAVGSQCLCPQQTHGARNVPWLLAPNGKNPARDCLRGRSSVC